MHKLKLFAKSTYYAVAVASAVYYMKQWFEFVDENAVMLLDEFSSKK